MTNPLAMWYHQVVGPREDGKVAIDILMAMLGRVRQSEITAAFMLTAPAFGQRRRVCPA